MNRADTTQPPHRKALHFVNVLEFYTMLRRLTYWLNRRFYCACHPPTGGECTHTNTTQPPHRKGMGRRYGWLLCLLCLAVPFVIADEAEIVAGDNHFQTHEERPQPAQPQQQIDPLMAYPVSQYIVHGVIVTADNAVAVVYSPRKTWHRLQVNAQLGQEQAVIRQITTKGIEIDMQNTLLWLPVLQ